MPLYPDSQNRINTLYASVSGKLKAEIQAARKSDETDDPIDVLVYDPIAMNECRRRIGDVVTYSADMYDVVLDADALLLLTEWKEFRLPGWGVIKKAMRRPLVIDGRNIFDTEELEENGFEYHCIGK